MKSAIITIKNSRYTFLVLAGGIIFFVSLYMFCINSAVRFAVARNNAEAKISSLEGSLSDLESKYMANTNSLTLEKAEASGLVDPSVKDFISKTSSGKSLTINR
jgi:hypothetical protein